MLDLTDSVFVYCDSSSNEESVSPCSGWPSLSSSVGAGGAVGKLIVALYLLVDLPHSASLDFLLEIARVRPQRCSLSV